MMQQTRCLVLALFEQIFLSIMMVDEVGSIRVADVTFDDLGAGSFMGFHDWLRTGSSPSTVIGLRFTPTDPESLAEATFNQVSYLKRQGEGMEIYFSKDNGYDPTISDDQSFQYSKLMRSPTGEFALVVDMASLSEDEVSQIERMVNQASSA